MALISNIKNSKNIKKIDFSNIISSDEYLNITLNGQPVEEYVKEFKGFDQYIPKIVYEDPENPNQLIIDHMYINYNGKDITSNDDIKDRTYISPFSNKNRVLMLDGPDLNKLKVKLKYNSIKFVNANITNCYIILGGKKDINDFTFELQGTESLIITDPKSCTNCTFKNNVKIKFEKFAYEEIRLAKLGDEKLPEYLEFLKKKLINCDFSGIYNGIMLHNNTKNLVKRGSKWYDLINNINYPEVPYKFYMK